MTARLLSYAGAAGITVAAVAVVFGMDLVLRGPFYTLLMIAVMLSAWLGGLGPGLLSSALGTFAINYFFQEPRFQLAVGSGGDAVQLLIFVSAAVLLSALVRSRERERAESAELLRLKSEFVNMVSHELRTPLASIRGSVELLLDEVGGLGPRQRRFLQTIRRSSDRLSSLVGDLLDLARLEAGKTELVLVPEDPRRVVRDAVRALQHQFKAKKQQVRVECDPDLPPIVVDRKRLEQVLVNLLGNASAYTPERGEVSVLARRDDNRVEIAVSDTGPGLSPEDERKVFEKFFRGGDAQTQNQYTGTGLGLTIAQSLVELHGGELTVRSELHHGSTFCVRLPTAVPVAQAS